VQEHLANPAIADRLESFAALLELAGASHYSARAYRRAAELIRSTDAPIADLVRKGRVRELRGIGAGIEARLVELVETGSIAEAEELERTVSPELIGVGRYLGFGPRTAIEIAQTLGIRTAAELREAAAAGRLREVPGIGPKTERKLLEALAADAAPAQRPAMLLNRARALLQSIAGALGGEIAGDPRRWRDENHDLAVVVAAEEPAPILERFAALAEIVAVVECARDRAVGITVDGTPVTCVAAASRRFGTELLRATGSTPYVDALEPLPEASDEEGVYRALGIPWCPPELREAPFRDDPPHLLERSDIRGDLHAHTTSSDGRATVLEMAEAARALGHEYLAICDHTTNVSVVPGLDADAVRRQGEEIAAVNEQVAPFRVLGGIECDILPDGRLDLPDDVLSELEWVQASVHAGQRTPRRALTDRVLEAMRHPAVRCLSHPKGRMINRRPENALDLEEVYALALETGIAMEVNGLPDRLDLRAEHVRDAIRTGVKIVCSTDAHSVAGLGNMGLSVATARRGWARRSDVLNTRAWDEIARR
jgi:DNA polymerase (family 10)